jgi:hypothetical protein
MTPREVWSALQTAPKVAGPWEPVERPDGLPHWCRRSIDGVEVAWTFTDGSVSVLVSELHVERRRSEPYPSRAAATAALKRMGWVVVTDGVPGCVHCDGEGDCSHCDRASVAR